MIKHEPPSIGITSIKLQSDNINLFSNLIFFLTQEHFKLIDIIRYSFILPWAYFKAMQSLKINNNYRILTQNHSKWKLVHIIIGY